MCYFFHFTLLPPFPNEPASFYIKNIVNVTDQRIEHVFMFRLEQMKEILKYVRNWMLKEEKRKVIPIDYIFFK